MTGIAILEIGKTRLQFYLYLCNTKKSMNGDFVQITPNTSAVWPNSPLRKLCFCRFESISSVSFWIKSGPDKTGISYSLLSLSNEVKILNMIKSINSSASLAHL